MAGYLFGGAAPLGLLQSLPLAPEFVLENAPSQHVALALGRAAHARKRSVRERHVPRGSGFGPYAQAWLLDDHRPGSWGGLVLLRWFFRHRDIHLFSGCGAHV